MSMEDENHPWGGPSPGFLAYLKNFTPIPSGEYFNPENSYHYRAPDGYVYDGSVVRGIYEMANMTAKPDDIYVCSFPKTGTTWAQEMVYLIGTNGDFQTANTIKLEERFPFMEWPGIGFKNLRDDLDRPRFIKTHLSYGNLPKSIVNVKPKIVYITRNPKDTLVSMYHFYAEIPDFGFIGNFDQFVDIFIKGEVTFGPYDKHVIEMWEQRHADNILFLMYEDLKKDLPGVIRKTAQFLNKSLSAEQVDAIAHHCSFQQMAVNKCTNYEQWHKLGLYRSPEARFMRKGKTGDWKSHFNKEINDKVDKWIEEKFGKENIPFRYEV